MEFDEFADDDDDRREAEYMADVKLDPEEERALEMFMDREKVQRGERRLADIVEEKIRDHQAQMEATSDPNSGLVIDPRVVDIYKRVAVLLKDYTCGKLPKAFKVLPALNNWEQLTYITRPDEWSPHAMCAAVKLFSYGLNAKMTQRFYNVILLPYTREALRTQRKLNFNLYFALKKALYKPTPFYKGFLLPLCESGTCTLREATIVGSVLAKMSVPMLHSAACIVKLAQMPYGGANSMFLRVLLDKKYSLPYMVVDEVCKHFAAFLGDDRRMVVLWHQCLLVFVQRYRNDLTVEQRDMLRALVRKHVHAVITPQVAYELDNAVCRQAPKK
eukprot:m51a1_g13016 putative bystin (331) ;mRNA; f:106-1461